MDDRTQHASATDEGMPENGGGPSDQADGSAAPVSEPETVPAEQEASE